ncbi:DoxX protein [Desulfosporosinus orientis DSM 765]|uniref:DoxX protein n=1 Tax=Desulfosporosinus orientis (strain ATCC 19365 / DSM 765 / NCIMB 8382 / VKM B-1628 / Singapore I) TaxID=768706 RepID=G7WGJ0_DESOD|nr:DoxX family membrane protein [Desulfosporosinus orientis]AET68067.1 DoxX protein [Desulfosporosinus orientis DSM 765]
MKHSIKSIIGLILRLYVGYDFLTSGWEKIISGFNGTAVTGFLKGGLAQTHGALLASKGAAAAAHPNVSDVWAWFISNVFIPSSPLVACFVKFGEFFVGLGLILGCFSALAAFFGIIMNFSYLLSGTVSVNPQLIIFQLIILLIGAAIYTIGVDQFFMGKLVAKYPVLQKGFFKVLFPVDNNSEV